MIIVIIIKIIIIKIIIIKIIIITHHCLPLELAPIHRTHHPYVPHPPAVLSVSSYRPLPLLRSVFSILQNTDMTNKS